MIFDYTFTMSFLVRNRLLSYFVAHINVTFQARIQNFFNGGGLRRKILKEKCFLIVILTRVHITIRQTCSSLSLLPFREDCLLFFALFFTLFYFWNLKEGGGWNPRNPLPPLDPPMHPFSRHSRVKQSGDVNGLAEILLSLVSHPTPITGCRK